MNGRVLALIVFASLGLWALAVGFVAVCSEVAKREPLWTPLILGTFAVLPTMWRYQEMIAEVASRELAASRAEAKAEVQK